MLGESVGWWWNLVVVVSVLFERIFGFCFVCFFFVMNVLVFGMFVCCCFLFGNLFLLLSEDVSWGLRVFGVESRGFFMFGFRNFGCWYFGGEVYIVWGVFLNVFVGEMVLVIFSFGFFLLNFLFFGFGFFFSKEGFIFFDIFKRSGVVIFMWNSVV